MLENLMLLWLTAVPLMGSPGPALLALAAVAAAHGARPSVRYLLGIIAGSFSVLLLVASGVTGAILAVPGLRLALVALAAGYILYLAWRIATAPPLARMPESGRAPRFLAAYLVALANPKAYAALGAVYTGNTLIEGGFGAWTVWVDAGAKLAAMLCVMITVNTAWMLFGAAFARFLTDPVAGRVINIGFAVLLVASVGLVVL